ncbi:hypothetical protein RJ639_042235 [Escallonia herrerae]|uniref:SHSP domain-containing protein n=1 Tax=Escallonia herrerae TaxID=1293975 RepID=A0AA88WLJ1_9ASTE|nr:hypothetical protein RJ639_026506 [Escallonia herrerae]KAK3027790.1 hypothetical protein RJ639_042235 [Escallonia herrerae]
MELGMELKLTEVLDDVAYADLMITKDRAGPLFLSTETETMFILTAHLKGYKKGNIKIEINEDGTRIAISGEKQVQETVMVGWRLYMKEMEMKSFRKAFKIPEGVVLDKIKAKYGEDESKLTISMPKLVKGITGVRIEEVKADEVSKTRSESLDIVADEVNGLQQDEYRERKTNAAQEVDESRERLPEAHQTRQGELVEAMQLKELHDLEETQEEEIAAQKYRLEEQESLKEAVELPMSGPDHQMNQEHRPPGGFPRVESEMEVQEYIHEKTSYCIQEEEPVYKKPVDQAENLRLKHATDEGQEEKSAETDIQEERKEEEKASAESQSSLGTAQEKSFSDRSTQTEKPPPRKPKCCTPLLAGSALFVSIIVFAIHFIRSKNQPSKTNNRVDDLRDKE